MSATNEKIEDRYYVCNYVHFTYEGFDNFYNFMYLYVEHIAFLESMRYLLDNEVLAVGPL